MATRERTFHLPGFDALRSKYMAWSVGIAIGIGGWLAIAAVFPMGLFPTPIESIVATEELMQTNSVWDHIWGTLSRSFIGFLGAALIGISLGVIMGLSNFGERFSTPYVVIGLAIPGIAWAAIWTIVLGLGGEAAILATTVTVFPYITLNVWKGVENIDTDLIKMSRSFGISRSRLLKRMVLPSVAPALFTASRFGVAIAWKAETAAELFATQNGIGKRAFETFARYQYDTTMAWAIVFVVVIILFEFLVFRPLERRVFSYRQDADFDVIG